jgi:hypothetical protein
MRAIVFDRYGEPDVLRLRDVPVPQLQDGTPYLKLLVVPDQPDALR